MKPKKKEQFKKLFKKELERSMCVIRGSWEKVVGFSARQQKNKLKIWQELD